jgi:hypothetical protein
MCEPWSYVLMFLSTLTLAMLLERALVLFFMFNLNLHLVLEIITKLWMENKLDRAEKLALALPKRSPFAQLARVALAYATATPERARRALDGIESDGVAVFRRRLRHFPFVAVLGAATGVAGTASLGGFSTLPEHTPRFAGLPVPTLPFATGALLTGVVLTAYLVFTARARQMSGRLAKMKTVFWDLMQSHPVRHPGD